MPQTILYYPSIDIPDGDWLRKAVLYWDHISSIVPYRKYEDFGAEVAYLKQCGVYRECYPEDVFASPYAAELNSTFLARVKRTCFPEDDLGDLADHRVRIHRKKFQAPLLHELLREHYLGPELEWMIREKKLLDDYDCDGWMVIDDRLANLYMRTLAEYTVKSNLEDTVLGTNNVASNRQIYRSASHRLENQCCQINLNRCLPIPARDVGFEQLLDFKEKYRDELTAFQGKIRELERNIYHSRSAEEIRFHEQSFIDSWQSCSEDYYKALTSSRIPFVTGSISALLGLPFMESFLPAQLPSYTLPLGAAALTICTNYINHRNTIHPNCVDHGFSYIIRGRRNGVIQG